MKNILTITLLMSLLESCVVKECDKDISNIYINNTSKDIYFTVFDNDYIQIDTILINGQLLKNRYNIDKADSIIINFEHAKQIKYLSEIADCISKNILCNDSYILKDKCPKIYTFTFTEEDYNNATPIP